MKKKLLLLITFLITFSFSFALSVNGGVVGKLRSESLTSTRGSRFLVTYSFGFNANKPSRIIFDLSNPAAIETSYLVSTVGQSDASCSLKTRTRVVCENVQPGVERSLNVFYKLVNNITSDQAVRIRMSAEDPKIKIESPLATVNIPYVKPLDGSFAKLEFSNLDINVGDEFPLVLEMAKGYDLSKVTYKSINPLVATVNASGVIRGISKGSTKILVLYGNDKKEITLNVNKKAEEACQVSGVTVANEFKLSAGEVRNMNLVVSNPCAKVSDLTFRVSDQSKVWVDKTGYLIGLKNGKADVSVSYNGQKLKTFSVQVGPLKTSHKSSAGTLIILILLIIVVIVVFYIYFKKPKNKIVRSVSQKSDDTSKQDKVNTSASTSDDSEEYLDDIQLDV